MSPVSPGEGVCVCIYIRACDGSLFMHRYRDLVPEIRAENIAALGEWMVAYPSLFLKDNYLKYFGWTMNDSVCSGRALLDRTSASVPTTHLWGRCGGAGGGGRTGSSGAPGRRSGAAGTVA